MVLLILLQSENSSNGIAQIILAIGSVLGILGGILSPFILYYVNKMSTKVDGLLDQKTLADKALGRIEGIDKAAKEKAIGDDRELKVMREQNLLNQTPPTRDIASNVSDVKDEIVEAVEEKADQTQKVVKKIPDEVVRKLPPK